MPSGNGYRVSRRQVLKVGAGTVVIGALGIEAAQTVAAAAQTPGAPAARGLAASGRVIEVEGDRVRVQVFGSTARLSAPVLGFPDVVAPRIGDHVTLTDLVDGYPIAALPLCHWVSGVPALHSDQTVAVGGSRVLPSAMVVEAGQRGAAVSVCVLDTSLASGQVLAVRS